MSIPYFYYEGRRFKNGKISIRFSPDEIKDLQSDQDALVLAVQKLGAFDCELISEAPECLGNWSWYVRLFCYYNGKNYSLYQKDIETLISGKTASLIPDQEGGT